MLASVLSLQEDIARWHDYAIPWRQNFIKCGGVGLHWFEVKSDFLYIWRSHIIIGKLCRIATCVGSFLACLLYVNNLLTPKMRKFAHNPTSQPTRYVISRNRHK